MPPEPAPMPPEPPPMPRSDLIQIIGIVVASVIGIIGAAAAVLTVFMMRRDNRIQHHHPNP